MPSFAHPGRFLRLAAALHPWLAAASCALLALGVYCSWFASPADYQQGETVRIMYLHVPAAWMAMGIYAAMGAASFAYLVWRHPLADVAARASAPVGMAFALLTLITGSLWGRPMWGAWWVWDMRLTSMLVLFFLYAGYVLLARQVEQEEPLKKACAVVALAGCVNLPVIKFSVEWWNTLHQPASVLRMAGPSIAAPMLWPLGIMAAAFALFYVTIAILGMRIILTRAKIWRLMRLTG